MKKIFFFTVIAILTSSCKKEATTSSEDKTAAQAQLQTNASSSGGAITFNDVYKFNLAGESYYNECTKEQMISSNWGVLLDIHGVYNGNMSTITAHANARGFKAVGEKSGMVYVGAGSSLEKQSTFSDGVFTTKLVHHEHAATAGGGYDVILTQTFYIKVDADGTITYIKEPVSEIHCQ